jgi:hypothetical protein
LAGYRFDKIERALIIKPAIHELLLYMNQSADDVMEKLGSDANLWHWAHPSKNDFGCRLAREGLKYQNCIQFIVKNGRVVGYVANVEKRW